MRGCLHRPRLLDMAENPEGYPLDAEQALLVVCSTQASHFFPTDWSEATPCCKRDTDFYSCTLLSH